MSQTEVLEQGTPAVIAPEEILTFFLLFFGVDVILTFWKSVDEGIHLVVDTRGGEARSFCGSDILYFGRLDLFLNLAIS
jgi:hypothetical protein